MTALLKSNKLERRWPVILTILLVMLLLNGLPTRISLFPSWPLYIIVTIETSLLAAVTLSRGKPVWLKAEYVSTMIFSILAGVLNMINLGKIIEEMLSPSANISGLQLLTSGIGVWTGNVLAFSLLYWLADRGGPDGRSNNISKKPDWLFPQESAPSEDTVAGWRPVFVDYLFLGYCTATAFSPTDVLPLTGRAKLLMIFESSISLLTILVVLSRAVNILGGH